MFLLRKYCVSFGQRFPKRRNANVKFPARRLKIRELLFSWEREIRPQLCTLIR